jgi:hypothetical protein
MDATQEFRTWKCGESLSELILKKRNHGTKHTFIKSFG